MSPEQVAGDAAGLDARIGRLRARRDPLRAAGRAAAVPTSHRKSFAEAARIIRDEEPTRLRSGDPRRARRRRDDRRQGAGEGAERRYSSAAELADDIRRYLRDEPIAARPPSAAYQVRKYARRHKAIVAGIVASLLALLVGVVATSWQSVRRDAGRTGGTGAGPRRRDGEGEG